MVFVIEITCLRDNEVRFISLKRTFCHVKAFTSRWIQKIEPIKFMCEINLQSLSSFDMI